MIATARPVAAAGAAHRLGEQLVRPLGGPLVGQVERDVGRDDADERDLRDVEALGDEARPDEHVQLAVGERVHDPRRSATPLDDVAIEPADAQRREARHAPRARRARCRRRGSGCAASRRPGSARERRAVAAVMAAQRHPRCVENERHAALRADLDVAAVAAEDDRRGAAAVDDQDRPLAGRRGRGPARAVDEPGREQAAIAGGQLRPKVDDLDDRPARRRRGRQRRSARYSPARARPEARPSGVALPRMTGAPARRPSSIATSRAW